MTLKVPYTDSLTTNADLPGQITVDMKAIEAEDQQDDRTRDEADSNEQEARKAADSKLSDRLDQLDKEKATHEDVNDLRDELLKKIKHIILGTDEETVKTVIQEMKKEGTI